MTQVSTLAQLTPAEKKALLLELQAEQENETKKREEEIASFKALQDSMIAEMLPRLVDFNEQQTRMVDRTYESLGALIDLKQELYKSRGMQDSHTFTHRDGSGSITVGFNTIIGFDGTETAGVQKVKEFIGSLSADDAKRETLGNLLNTFMKPDKKGNLNPTRVTELFQQKAEINDPLFSEGIDIIVNSQFKTRTSRFVRGWKRIVKDDKSEVKLTFSITA